MTINKGHHTPFLDLLEKLDKKYSDEVLQFQKGLTPVHHQEEKSKEEKQCAQCKD